MRKHLFYKYLSIISISIFIVFLTTGCQNKSSGFQLFIFTNVPDETKQQIQTLINNHSEGEQSIEVQFHPPMYEKIVVEFVDHSGDLILLEKELLTSIFDPVGLLPLDQIKNEKNSANIQEYQLKDEEGNIHIYALPIPLESSLLKDLNYDGSKELVGIIPKYTKHQDDAYSILSELVNNK